LDSEKIPKPPAAEDHPTSTPSATTESVVSVPTAETVSTPSPVDEKARAAMLIKAAAGLPPTGKEPRGNGEANALRETPAGTPPAARVAPGAAKSTTTPTAGVAKGIPKPVAAKQPATLVESAPEPPINRMRRRVVWASIAGFLGVSFLMFLRFFLPRSIFEPSSVFRVGFPGDYALGVDTKYQQQYRIWVTKTTDRLFVIYAVCTHLGCTPDWKASENKFKCPCHGSGYDSEGINFEGPAPRPMDRAHVEIDAEGQIIVDTGRLYAWPKGGENKFDEEGAYIQI